MPKKRTHEEAVEIANNFGFKLLDVYVNNTTPVTFYHEDCKRTFSKNFKEFLKYESKCLPCNKEEPRPNLERSYRHNPEDLVSAFNSLENTNGYIPLDLVEAYHTSKSKIRFHHDECGKEFSMSWNEFQQGHRCNCLKAVKKRLSKAEVNRQVSLIDELKFIDARYDKGKRSQVVKVIHNNCGSEYEVSLRVLQAGGIGCGNCRTSRGENAVKSALDKHGMPYNREVSFTECKNRSPLYFDFCVFISPDEYILIEFDGIQHYKESFRGGSLEKTQVNDAIKNKFCNEWKIPLIRIPYTVDLKTIKSKLAILIENVQRLSDDDSFVIIME